MIPARRRTIAAVLALIALALVLRIGWRFYEDRYLVTAAPTAPDGAAVTQIVTAQLSGLRQLRVATLSGIVQAAASDVRGFGWLRSDQIVKMPYSVDYFVDLARLRPGDLQWNAQTRTLIVDAPELIVAPPNTDEGWRTLVRTGGLFVTRAAGEDLAQRTSRAAAARAETTARSPERMAQAREHARQAIAATMAAPLAAAGLGSPRIVVTFPAERGGRSGEQMDRSRSLEEVYAR